MPVQTLDPATGVRIMERPAETVEPSKGWHTLLWNDEVTLAEYVAAVLQRLLKCDKATAVGYMLTAHTEGKAAVFAGTKDEAVDMAGSLAGAGLWSSAEASD